MYFHIPVSVRLENLPAVVAIWCSVTICWGSVEKVEKLMCNELEKSETFESFKLLKIVYENTYKQQEVFASSSPKLCVCVFFIPSKIDWASLFIHKLSEKSIKFAWNVKKYHLTDQTTPIKHRLIWHAL